MLTVRRVARSCAVLLLGKKTKPRRIMSGLARGYRLDVSPAEHLSYLLGTNEPHLQSAIRQFVSAGDTVYDIGASLGYVSLSLAKRVGPQGRVIAFEPFAQSIVKFRKNIELNSVKNIRLLESAASDDAGETTMRVLENPSTASLVWHRDSTCAKEFTIRTVRIDDLVDARELPYPNFVKIDVEGAEASVLQGMSRTLATARPALFVECSEIGREKSWHLLQGLGYTCQSAITRTMVESFENYRHSDFLWLP